MCKPSYKSKKEEVETGNDKTESRENKTGSASGEPCDCSRCREEKRQSLPASLDEERSGLLSIDELKPPSLNPALENIIKIMSDMPQNADSLINSESDQQRISTASAPGIQYMLDNPPLFAGIRSNNPSNAETVAANSLKIEILGSKVIKITGRCGKAYQMSIEDFLLLNTRINSKIKLEKQKKDVELTEKIHKEELEKFKWLQKADDELEPAKNLAFPSRALYPRKR